MRRKGFTLVELLVVIGIIAVLIAILLPTLGNARRQSMAVKCLASMRQIGYGFQLYANAYKGAWPCAVHDWGNPTYPLPTGRQMRWQDRILPFISNIKGIDDFKELATLPLEDMKRTSVLWGCPAYRLQDGFSNGNDIDDQVRTGYSMNVYPTLPGASLNKDKPYIQGTNPPFTGSLATTAQTGRYFKFTEWRKPAERLLIAEGLAYFIQMSPAARVGTSFTPASMPWFPFQNTSVPVTNWETQCYFWVEGSRHAKPGITQKQSYNEPFMNALFCDGHAAKVSVREAWQAICNPGASDAPTYR